MSAGEIRALAERAGVGPGRPCSTWAAASPGPGSYLARELGCDYLGVDFSASAVAIARERADDLCRFAVGRVPPLPPGTFDVVLLLEAMLAFEEKEALVRAVAAALRPGGRFAFTLEAGSAAHGGRAGGDARRRHGLAHPARGADRAARAGRARAHVAGGPQPRAPPRRRRRSLAAYAADADAIAAQIGRRALGDLLAAHALWIEWLDEGRVRKLALVAERVA